MFSFRNYILVGIAFGLMTYLILWLFGPDVAVYGANLQRDAFLVGQGGFGDAMGQPLVTMGQNPLAGAIIMIFIWPLTFIYILLLGVLLLIINGGDLSDSTTTMINTLLS